MSLGNLAYLALVVGGYAVFIVVLAAYWLRQFVADGQAKRSAASVQSPAARPASTDHRRAA